MAGDGLLHLHRLEHDDEVTGLDDGAAFDGDLHDRPLHRAGEAVTGRRCGAASFVLAASTHTEIVQEHLGHSSHAITADVHSHVAPTQAREAADRMDEAIRW